MGLSFCYDVGNRGKAARGCMQNWNDHAGSCLRKLYPGAKNDAWIYNISATNKKVDSQVEIL